LSTHTHQAHANKWETSPENVVDETSTSIPVKGSAAVSAKIMDGYFAKGTKPIFATKDGFMRHFVAWIIDDNLPWTTGETPGIVRFFQFLKVRWTLPSDTTVRNMVAKIFTELRANLVKELTVSIYIDPASSDISANTIHRLSNPRYHTRLTTGQTKQMVFTFAGTIASFINDDWELCEHLVDFHHIEDKEHEGIHAAKAFIQTAVTRGGLNKISSGLCLVFACPDCSLCCQYFLAVCLDNASSCDTFARATGKFLQDRYGIQFHEGNARIRCMAHVVNLIVQAMLASLDEAKDLDEEDYFVPNKHLPFHYVTTH